MVNNLKYIMPIKINKIKTTNIEMTDAISSYVNKCISAFEKYVDPEDTSVSVDVEIGKTTNHHNTGQIFRAEINFFVGGKTFRAVSKKEDLYAALDDVKDEMSRELNHDKKKRHTLLKRGGAAIKNLLRGLKK